MLPPDPECDKEVLLAIRDSPTAFISPRLRTWQIGTPMKDFLGIKVGGNLSRVTGKALDETELQDFIPPQRGLFAHLEESKLWNNQLKGPIPAQLGQLAQLVRMELESKHLAGPIPAELGHKLALLEILRSSTSGWLGLFLRS